MGCGAHIIQDGLSTALNILMPLIAQSFGLSLSDVGIVKAIKSAIETPLEILSGILSERVGERRLMAFGLLCSGIGYGALSYASSFSAIMFCLILFGVGSSFQHALSSAIISRAYSPAARKSALGIYNSSGDAGKLLFTGIFGLAIGYNIAWQSSVFSMGIIAIIFAAILLYILTRYQIGGAIIAHDAGDKKPSTKGWGILDKGNFAKLCLSVFFDTAVQTSFFVFIVFYIVEKGADIKIASLALVLTLIGGMFGKVGCGFLADKLGTSKAFILIKCCAASAIISLNFAGLAASFILLPILGMFLQGSTSITYGSIADLIDANKQSRGFAMVYTVSSGSAILGPLFFGYIGDFFGLNMTMSLMAATSIIAFIPILSYRPVITH